MQRLNIKPLSVNQAYQGKRFRTPLYKRFIQSVWTLLMTLKGRVRKPPENTPLFVHYRWGLSYMGGDVDNPCKPFQDILFHDFWHLKDHHVEWLLAEKTKVEKGDEFIEFHVASKEELIDYLEQYIEHLKQQDDPNK